MWCRAIGMACALAVGACSTAGSTDGRPPESRAGNAVVSAVGTPFLLVFKGVVCAFSVAVAAPIAGAASLSPSPSGRSAVESLGDGIGHNCGPPYVVSR